MIEIRQPEERDRPAMIGLMRIAFNPASAWTRIIAPEIRLDRFLGAFEDGRLLAMVQTWGLRQWFGGRALPMAGIAAVASAPERRGDGLAPRVLRAALAEAREKGALVSTLYPSRAAVYRRLGYEYSGILTQYRVSLADLPADEGPCRPREGTDADVDAIRECYGRFAAGQSGFVGSDDEDWWRLRVLRGWNPDVTTRVVVVENAGRAEGYATFQIDPVPDTWGFRIVCTHLVAATSAAARSLLSYFRGYRGLGQSLSWYGSPCEPLSLLIGGGAESLHAARTLRFMTRLLDVARALEDRVYPEVSGEATIAVRDELFPENEGPFRIVAEGGRVRVARTRTGAGTTIPIGSLTALTTGYATPQDLVRVGLLEGNDAAIPLLSSLFAARTPWMIDFF